MSESKPRIPEHPLTEGQRELAEFDQKLTAPATDESATALIPIGSTELIPYDDEVLFPEPIVGKLYELAQHPERSTEEELQTGIDTAEVLLQKLELRAKLAAPKALPKIAWILGIFIPEIRKQLAEHFKRKQQAAELADQSNTIAEAVNPIVKELKRQMLLKRGEYLPTDTDADKLVRQEKVKLLEREWAKIEALARDPFLENPILIHKVTISESSRNAARDALKKSRLSNLFVYAEGKTDAESKLNQFVAELNQSLQHAGITISISSQDYGESQAYFDSNGFEQYKFYNIQPVVVKIKVAILEFKKALQEARDVI